MSVRCGTERQLKMITVSAESLVGAEHPLRKVAKIFDDRGIVKKFSKLYSETGRDSYPVRLGVRALVIQYMKDYSDRQMEQALAENIAVKWYCGLELDDATPDHSYFGRFRARLGTQGTAQLFKELTKQFRAAGMVSDVFAFVDATAIITKNALWKERDKAIGDGLDKLDNASVCEYAADKDARFGCKGKDKFWFGYKRHHSVDMKEGMVTKVAVTPANVPDGRAVKHVLQPGTMVFADKGYCTEAAQTSMAQAGCHSGAIKKRNMKGKDRDKDRWLTRVRMPYEGNFSKLGKRARYRGWAKVQLQAFMQAFAHNLKRALVLYDLKPQLFAG